ncbi:hypothetical protein B0H13DRAFT_2351723 [Mycena leptocephala]|nr:hypothetical protein B0H13DRAFT_2351723 [Mycena leptocephala]
MCDEAFFLVPDDSLSMVTSAHSIMRDGALFPMCDSASPRTRERLLFPPFFHERRNSSHVSDAPWTHSVRDDASFSCANAFSFLHRRYASLYANALNPHGARLYLLLVCDSTLTQYATERLSSLARINAFPFMTDGAPSHLREALWTQSVRNGTLFLVRDGALFPCAPVPSHLLPHVEYPSHARQHRLYAHGAALVSDGAFTHCASFLVWNILPMCDSTLLFTRDGAAFSLPMGTSLTVSFIVRDGGLLPSVTVPFISCAFFPRATVPSSRVQRKSSVCTTAPSLFARDAGARSHRFARCVKAPHSRTRWRSLASCTTHYGLCRSLHPPFTCDDALISAAFLVHFVTSTLHIARCMASDTSPFPVSGHARRSYLMSPILEATLVVGTYPTACTAAPPPVAAP